MRKKGERLSLRGTANLSGVGNSLDNLLFGNAGTNTLSGAAGNDSLDGGVGADSLVGGTGNDAYYVDNAGDTVLELTGAGNDTVFSTVSHTLTNFVERLELRGTADVSGVGNGQENVMIGNAGRNTLAGGAGNDSLDGAVGADSLVGGTGNDAFYIDNAGDTVLELTGEGNDTVFSTVSHTLSDFVERLELRGTADIAGTGNDQVNSLNGNAGNNTLSGGGGHDSLAGLAGADSLIGGTGDDSYFIDDAVDTVLELAGEGNDTVFSTVSFTMSDFVERLELRGTADIAGTGSDQDNSIAGNSGANLLSGGGGNDILNGLAGADTLVGGTGNDSYFIDATTDAILELSGEGTDTVSSSVTYTLSDFVEILTLSGTVNINGTGSAQENTINGNSGANLLFGAAGNDLLSGGGSADTMRGGEGQDTLAGGSGADVFLFASVGEGGDRITDYSVLDDTIQISASGFGGGLSAGMNLAANGRYAANVAGVATVAGTGQFVFDTDDRILWWDDNGTDAGGATQIAVLVGVSGFVSTEIQIIA